MATSVKEALVSAQADAKVARMRKEKARFGGVTRSTFHQQRQDAIKAEQMERMWRTYEREQGLTHNLAEGDEGQRRKQRRRRQR